MNKWKVLVIHCGGGTYYKEYRGLAAWDKPTEGAETGDVLLEIDTGKVFCYEAGSWYSLTV